jgi:hypothetical protein
MVKPDRVIYARNKSAAAFAHLSVVGAIKMHLPHHRHGPRSNVAGALEGKRVIGSRLAGSGSRICA